MFKCFRDQVSGVLLACALGLGGWGAARAGCVDEPFPSQPTAPVIASVELPSALADGARYRVRAWRVSCPASGSQLLFTLDPVVGQPYVAGTPFASIVQNGRQFSFDWSRSATAVQPVTGLIGRPVTVVTLVLDSGFSEHSAFRILFFDRFNQQIGTLDVPAGSGGGGDSGDGPLPFHGAHSGVYYDPGRSGEGGVVEFARTEGGYAASFTMYTFDDQGTREPMWLVGGGGYVPGARSLSFDLYRARGALFGAAFRASDVQLIRWGRVSLSIPACGLLDVTLERADGQRVVLEWERLGVELHGVACP